MKNFLIIPNMSKRNALSFTHTLSSFLLDRNQGVFVLPGDMPDDTLPVISLEELDSIDVVIVLGGDGTVLRCVRQLSHCSKELPIFAVNFGRLGYLTECDPDDAITHIQRIICDDYRVEARTLLSGHINRNNDTVSRFIAINEAVIARGTLMHPLSLKLNLNSNYISTFSADGVLVATPTGSTAYNLSAGGPLLTPCSESFVITPICSMSAPQCSIVTSADDVIDVTLEPFASPVNHDSSAILSVDSILNYPLFPLDSVHLVRSQKTVSFIKTNDISFYIALQKRLSAQR